MVSEVSDIKQFISNLAIFNHLDSSTLENIAKNISVGYEKTGKNFRYNQQDASENPELIVVRSGSLELRMADGQLKDKLSGGDVIVPAILIANTPRKIQAVVLEDCLYYEVRGPTYNLLSKSDEKIANFLESYRRTYVEDEAVKNQDIGSFTQPSQGVALQRVQEALINESVRSAMNSPAICVNASISIQQAAVLMKSKNISSLLVTDQNKLLGILTDRDFRTRVLAEALPLDRPIQEVMTSKPVKVEVNRSLHEAQLLMMSEGIHHLPVVEAEQPIGILSLSDILKTRNTEPLSLIGSMKKASNVEELSAYAKNLPGLVSNLIERDVRAVEIGEVITAFTDAMTRRLIVLAEEKFGSPNVDYTWLAFGSQARQEQMLGSDQDNAIIFERELNQGEREYFAKFTSYINQGLNQCGIPLCPGNIMASNPQWQLSLKAWKDCFMQWIERPDQKALMHASIFFDLRRVAGDRAMADELQTFILQKARKNTIFQALMTDNAMENTPPLGFFKQFVLENDGNHIHSLDLKKRGTIPIVDFARNYSLSEGVSQVNTLSRLKALMQEASLSNELASSLIDAHEFIAGIRLEAQAVEYRNKTRIDNYIDPRSLSPLLRQQLKEAFQVVRNAQTAMKARFGAGVI